MKQSHTGSLQPGGQIIEEDLEGENRESQDTFVELKIAVDAGPDVAATSDLQSPNAAGKINGTIEGNSTASRFMSQVNRDDSRHPSDSNASNDKSQEEEEEKAFVEKYFSRQARGQILTAEMLVQGRRRFTSVAEAKERLKKLPY